MTHAVTIPIKTGRGLNDRLCWQVRHRLAQKQRDAVRLLWPWKWRNVAWKFPVVVTLTRIKPGGRPLDDDNLRGAAKCIRDQVAAELLVDDGDTTKLRFEYAQERGPWGMRIEITEAA